MERKISLCSLMFVQLLIFGCFYTIMSAPVGEWLAACDTVKFLQSSNYTADCHGMTKPVAFSKDNKIAMCMMVLDMSNKICAFISRVPVNKKASSFKLPDTTKEFDDEIHKLEPKPEDYNKFMEDILCESTDNFNKFNSLGIESDPSLVEWIKYTNETLLSSDECKYTCHLQKPHRKVKPICMLLFWANSELFNKMKPLHTLPAKENIPNKQELVPGQDSPVQKQEKLEPEEKKKIDHIDVHNLEEHEFDTRINIPVSENKETQQQVSAQNLPVDVPNTKKDDDSKQKLQTESVHNDYETKKDAEAHKEESQPKQDKVNLASSTKTQQAKPVIPQSQDAVGESAIIAQSDDGTMDKNADDFNSEEHHKPANQNDVEDGNEHDNIDNNINNNNGKESNLDDGLGLENNLGNQRERLKNTNNLYPHSSLAKEEDESHFFTYFSIVTILFIGLYVGYHNKQKILAMVLEGRRSRRGRGSRRRPSTASYRKLDCNLEEAVTSQCNSNVTHVIY